MERAECETLSLSDHFGKKWLRLFSGGFNFNTSETQARSFYLCSANARPTRTAGTPSRQDPAERAELETLSCFDHVGKEWLHLFSGGFNFKPVKRRQDRSTCVPRRRGPHGQHRHHRDRTWRNERNVRLCDCLTIVPKSGFPFSGWLQLQYK